MVIEVATVIEEDMDEAEVVMAAEEEEAVAEEAAMVIEAQGENLTERMIGEDMGMIEKMAWKEETMKGGMIETLLL
jgi:hypothetical protein